MCKMQATQVLSICQSAIVDLNHVLTRRSIENVRSANAVVTGKVVSTLSSNLMLGQLSVHCSKASTTLLAIKMNQSSN